MKLVSGTEIVGGCALVILLAVALSAVMAFPTMWLWNWLAPSIFGLKTITAMQAWGLNVLSSVLFKSSTTTKSNK